MRICDLNNYENKTRIDFHFPGFVVQDALDERYKKQKLHKGEFFVYLLLEEEFEGPKWLHLWLENVINSINSKIKVFSINEDWFLKICDVIQNVSKRITLHIKKNNVDLISTNYFNVYIVCNEEDFIFFKNSVDKKFKKLNRFFGSVFCNINKNNEFLDIGVAYSYQFIDNIYDQLYDIEEEVDLNDGVDILSNIFNWEIKEIFVKSLPKIVYLEGDILSLDGLEVYGILENGLIKDITKDCEIPMNNKTLSLDDKKIEVIHKKTNLTTSFHIKIKEYKPNITKISFVNLQNYYFDGDCINPDFKIYGFDNIKKINIDITNDCKISPNISQPLNRNIKCLKICYLNKNHLIPINVVPKIIIPKKKKIPKVDSTTLIEEIEIESWPKTTFDESDKLDLRGLKVVGFPWDKSSIIDVTSKCTTYPENGTPLSVKDSKVIIKYNDTNIKTEYNIRVLPQSLSTIDLEIEIKKLLGDFVEAKANELISVDFNEKNKAIKSNFYKKNIVKKILTHASNQDFSLNRNQCEALGQLLTGENCLLKGDAGTGKTFLIKYFFENIAKNGYKVLLTAPSSQALNDYEWQDNVFVGTIFNAFKLNKSIYHINDEINIAVAKNEISKFDVIIIDEISLLRVDIFRYISKIIIAANKIREKNNQNPIQLILTGDFYQLPPQMPIKNLESFKNEYCKNDSFEGYCFEDSESWNFWDFKIVTLWDNIRQKNDTILATALSILKNTNNPQLIEKFFNKLNRKCYIKKQKNNVIAFFSFQKDVDKYNEKCLENYYLEGNDITCTANTTDDINLLINYSNKVKRIFSDKFPLPYSFKIREGSPVIFLREDDQHNSDERWFHFGDTGKVFKCCEDYISIILSNPPHKKIVFIKNDTKVDYTWDGEKYYLQEYLIPKSQVLVKNDTGDVLEQNFYKGVFVQYPFKPAYGMSIRDSQGKTFKSIQLDPTNIRTNGELYVALSRVESINGLYLLNKIKFSIDEETNKVLGHLKSSKKVDDFYISIKDREIIKPLKAENDKMNELAKIIEKWIDEDFSIKFGSDKLIKYSELKNESATFSIKLRNEIIKRNGHIELANYHRLELKKLRESEHDYRTPTLIQDEEKALAHEEAIIESINDKIYEIKNELWENNTKD